jgi:hypothetical protein
MKTGLRAMMTLLLGTLWLAILSAGAAAPKECKSMLGIDDVATALGKDVRIQPVFSGGGLMGWRLYNVRASKQLSALGIPEGSLISGLCGVPAREVFANHGEACCPVDVSRQFEATIRVAGQNTKVFINRNSTTLAK